MKKNPTLERTEPPQDLDPVTQIDIPARTTLAVEQGPGYHIILQDLNRELQVGEQVDLTFTFQHAEPVQVTAPVQMPVPQGQQP